MQIEINDVIRFIFKNIWWIILFFYFISFIKKFLDKYKEEFNQKKPEDFSESYRPDDDLDEELNENEYIDYESEEKKYEDYLEDQFEKNYDDADFNNGGHKKTLIDVENIKFVKSAKKEIVDKVDNLLSNEKKSLNKDNKTKKHIFDFIEKNYNTTQKAFIYSEIFKRPEE
ncbi:MAG: hypothetical protein OEZ13_02115 [Spirochaetia bacterium]|nr:hypothetical protein [Spirochaetia bacterium]